MSHQTDAQGNTGDISDDNDTLYSYCVVCQSNVSSVKKEVEIDR